MNNWTNISTLGEKNSRKKSAWVFVLKLSFSLGLIGLVLFFVDFRNLVKILFNLNPWYLPIYVALIYIDRALMAYKWGLLLRAVNLRVPFFTLFQTYTIAPLSGILLPSTIGGDLFRFYSLSRFKANRAVFASMIVERMVGFIAMLIIAAMSLGLAFYLMKDGWVHFRGIIWALLLGAIIVSSLVGAMMHNVFRGRIDKLAERFKKYPVIVKLYYLYIQLCEHRNHLRTVAIVFAWTFLEQMVPIVANFLMVHALHINASFLELVVIIPLTVLATRLPISLDGIGVNEGLYVVLFGFIGVSASEAFLLSTIGRVLPLLCVLPWGIYYIMIGRHAALVQQQVTSVKPQ